MKKAALLISCLFLSAWIFALQPGHVDLNQSIQFPEDCQKLLSQLSLRQKIGQLCMVAAISNEERNQQQIENWKAWQPLYRLNTSYIENLITESEVGGIVFFGHDTYPEEQLALTQHFQSLSRVPLFIAIDAECGLGSCLNKKKVIRFPYNMALGAINDEYLTYKVAYEVAEQLKTLGVHINFAPVVDVNNNPNNPVIGMRSFGSNPQMVANLGIAYMKGLQDAGIIACAKHFPGHGDTSIDSHVALPIIPHSREHLEQIEFYPFKQLIDAGVQSVMTSFLEIPALEPTPHLPAALSHNIVTDILQNQFNFQGLVITDALGMKGVADAFTPGEVEVKALLAGSDIILCPLDAALAIDRIEQAVLNGEISEEAINKKALKVLTAKSKAFEQAKHTKNDLTRLHASQAYDLKKLVCEKAITLYKAQSSELLPQNTSIVIATDSDLSTFSKALQTKYPQLTTQKLFDTSTDATHVIIALTWEFLFEKVEKTAQLTNYIHELKNQGKSVTALLFCSPYRIPFVQEADTIIVGYEYTPETQNICAEVLSGTKKAEGKLPVQI